MTIQQAAATAAQTDRPASRYDRATILLHWLTAALVILLFALAEIWASCRAARRCGRARSHCTSPAACC
ncbi:hypothetical protein [Inquilinus sp. Marseille-Q2685]|uniref:hypothetical protein n=1 Tax=Inquilinus sp. Marseille-Q2685 TaxID=2866581 RepID=UPI001CE40B72|nr:hypothetical protein [Inquilinus sp. Marseille-Q2685]